MGRLLNARCRAIRTFLGKHERTQPLTKFAQGYSSQTFNGTPLVVAGAIYLIITIPLTRLVSQLEKRNRAIR